MLSETEAQQRKEERAIESRKVRDMLISKCDWTHSTSDWDVPQKEEWRLYRASLRDLPLHPLFPEMSNHNDEYPKPPNNPAQIVQKYVYDEKAENKWVANPESIEPNEDSVTEDSVAEEPVAEVVSE